MSGDQLRSAWGALIGRKAPAFKEIAREKVDEAKRDGYIEFLDILRLKEHGETLPVVSLYPAKKWNGRVVVWLDGKGKNGMFDATGKPVKGVMEMLNEGTSLVGVDLFGQGEFLEAGKSQDDVRVVKNPREFAGYSFAYNHTLFARRVHDVMSLISWVSGFEEEKPQEVMVIAKGGIEPVALAALSQVNGVKNVTLEKTKFRFANLKSYRDPNFLPGAVKYGDLPALMKLSRAKITE